MKVKFEVIQLEPAAVLDAAGTPQKSVHLIARAVGPAYTPVPEEKDEHGVVTTPASRVLNARHPDTLQALVVPSAQIVMNLNDASKLGAMKVGDTFEIEIGA
jgi:hypothetical protein